MWDMLKVSEYILNWLYFAFVQFLCHDCVSVACQLSSSKQSCIVSHVLLFSNLHYQSVRSTSCLRHLRCQHTSSCHQLPLTLCTPYTVSTPCSSCCPAAGSYHLVVIRWRVEAPHPVHSSWLAPLNSNKFAKFLLVSNPPPQTVDRGLDECTCVLWVPEPGLLFFVLPDLWG